MGGGCRAPCPDELVFSKNREFTDYKPQKSIKRWFISENFKIKSSGTSHCFLFLSENNNFISNENRVTKSGMIYEFGL